MARPANYLYQENLPYGLMISAFPARLLTIDRRAGFRILRNKIMNNAMKTVKGPLTDGFLLTDIRPRIGPSFRNRKKTKSVITLVTGAILVFSLLMTGLPSGGRKV